MTKSLSKTAAIVAFSFFSTACIAQEISDFDEKVRQTLLRNPHIIVEVFQLLEAEKKRDARTADLSLISKYEDQLFGTGQDTPVLVEFFDYACGYCKKVYQEVAQLKEQQKDVTVIQFQLPILGQASHDLASMMLGLRNIEGQGAYTEGHEYLMKAKGAALEGFKVWVSEKGYNLPAIEAAALSDAVTAEIQATYELARGLKIEGTPAFVTRQKIIRGYASAETLAGAV